jgi:hypothetical protein
MSVLDVFVDADVDIDDDVMPFGSDFSIHLPPAAPVLLFYYMFPSKQDPIRRLVKYSLKVSTILTHASNAFLPEEWTYVDGVVARECSGDSVDVASNFNSDVTSRVLVKTKY